MKNMKDIKREILADPAARADCEGMAAEFAMTRELISARSRAGLTQSDVAQRMGTTQSVIARLESGGRIPSLRKVQRYAQALGARAVVRIEPQTGREPLPAAGSSGSRVARGFLLISIASEKHATALAANTLSKAED